MNRDKYTSIKKYAAFLFMVFTVLAGTSDRYDTPNMARMGKSFYFNAFGSNERLLQSTGSYRLETKYNKVREDYKAFIGGAISEKSAVFGPDLLCLGILLPVFFYINNGIAKNAIWKNAVF